MTIPTPENEAPEGAGPYAGQQPPVPDSAGPAAPEGGRQAAPQTGHPEIDRALGDLDDLNDADLPTHHDRLANAHETLHRALHPDESEQS